MKPDGTAERRTLELGGTQDGIAVVLHGIVAGETVAVEGQYRLTDGARVQVDPSSPAAAAAASQPRAVVKNDLAP